MRSFLLFIQLFFSFHFSSSPSFRVLVCHYLLMSSFFTHDIEMSSNSETKKLRDHGWKYFFSDKESLGVWVRIYEEWSLFLASYVCQWCNAHHSLFGCDVNHFLYFILFSFDFTFVFFLQFFFVLFFHIWFVVVELLFPRLFFSRLLRFANRAKGLRSFPCYQQTIHCVCVLIYWFGCVCVCDVSTSLNENRRQNQIHRRFMIFNNTILPYNVNITTVYRNILHAP